ncbi:MAG TPA: DegT/DnrJ/EryC1/StrS family aminotransferase [Bacteroidales bacterium]|jgi:dTDP-4-amino-4,6-dideoxygalactose transaminase|nr:DegT/DnrJ/EryC1/StrS family aminotransferase [Bacteroidales bacterium]
MKLPISFYGLDRFYAEYRNSILQITDMSFENGYFLDSPEVNAFEQALARYVGRKFAVTVSSCTDALFLSLKALNIRPNDEVLVPAFSFIASLSPIIHCGATPVFLDVNKNDLTLKTDEIEKKITNKTKAIVVVQLFGGVNRFEPLETISKKYAIPIIEDAAQALGASFGNRKAGTLGMASCISFDPSKIIHAFGTGGAVLTDDELFYQQIKRLHYHGKVNKDFLEAGFNSRISSSQAALLNWQLNQLDEWLKIREKKVELYKSHLSDVKPISFFETHVNVKNTFHKMAIITEKRDELKAFLSQKGIQTNIHYEKLLYEYGLMQKHPFKAESINDANFIKDHELTLPLYPQLTDEEIIYICNAIKSFYQ